MKTFHVKQKVIIALEFDIELDDLTDPSDIINSGISISNYLAPDSHFSTIGEQEEAISTEIYKEGEEEFPNWTWEKESEDG